MSTKTIKQSNRKSIILQLLESHGASPELIQGLKHRNDIREVSEGTVLYHPKRNKLVVILNVFIPRKCKGNKYDLINYAIFRAMTYENLAEGGYHDTILIDPFDWEIIGSI